jgi:hypothetical protein
MLLLPDQPNLQTDKIQIQPNANHFFQNFFKVSTIFYVGVNADYEECVWTVDFWVSVMVGSWADLDVWGFQRHKWGGLGISSRFLTVGSHSGSRSFY